MAMYVDQWTVASMSLAW